MSHNDYVLESESYAEYIDMVAGLCDVQELLCSILWHMDEDDKINILAPAVADCGEILYDEFEYEELKHDND